MEFNTLFIILVNVVMFLNILTAVFKKRIVYGRIAFPPGFVVLHKEKDPAKFKNILIVSIVIQVILILAFYAVVKGI